MTRKSIKRYFNEKIHSVEDRLFWTYSYCSIPMDLRVKVRALGTRAHHRLYAKLYLRTYSAIRLALP